MTKNQGVSTVFFEIVICGHNYFLVSSLEVIVSIVR